MLATGLRTSEIPQVHPEHVDGRVLLLGEYSGFGSLVPLSDEALEILGRIDFGMMPGKDQGIRGFFQKAVTAAGEKRKEMKNLRIHALRRKAALRLADKKICNLVRRIFLRNMPDTMGQSRLVTSEDGYKKLVSKIAEYVSSKENS